MQPEFGGESELMTNENTTTGNTRSDSNRQRLFIRYFTAVLVDLVVLNLFDEYWAAVAIESFTVSLFAAVLLQVLLQATIAIEHRVAGYIMEKFGSKARLLSAWAIMFTSKIIILEAINFSFGDAVFFGGPIHGLVAFVLVVLALFAAEQAIMRLHKALA
jgi:hypothetical protein